MEEKPLRDQDSEENIRSSEIHDDECVSCLDLTSFQLHDLQETGLPPTLIELDLTANRLSVLNSLIAVHSQLKKLSLRQNRFEDAGIDPISSWDSISGLQELILRDNKLMKFQMSAFLRVFWYLTCLSMRYHH